MQKIKAAISVVALLVALAGAVTARSGVNPMGTAACTAVCYCSKIVCPGDLTRCVNQVGQWVYCCDWCGIH